MAAAVHVAIIKKPYLDLILKGRKTIESRLTITKGRAFNRVAAGDVIYFKQTSGPIRATAVAAQVDHLSELTPRQIAKIRRDYGKEIAAPAEYWRERARCKFGTLVWLTHVTPCDKGPNYRLWKDFGPRSAWFTQNE